MGCDDPPSKGVGTPHQCSRVTKKNEVNESSNILRTRLVKQGSVGNLKPGQLAHHGLEVEQRLHTALRDFGLVRSILCVPAWVLEDASLDHCRDVAVEVAHAYICTFIYIYLEYGWGGTVIISYHMAL